MDNTAVAHPAELVETLTRMGLADLLSGYVARQRVGVRFLSLERYAAQFSYKFDREFGNVYGRLMLVPTPPAAPVPIMRLITRSDHAAVHGSRRAAA